MERLQKAISAAGICSRRKAETLIQEGKVEVNGEIVTILGTKVNPNDEIIVEGIKLKKEGKEYYLLNKPRAYVCTVDDDKGRKIITDLIKTNKRIFPVGRLDYDTSGLILLTNDGELTNVLTHPNNDIPKTYVAKIKGFLTKEQINKLSKGIMLNGKRTKKAKIKVKKYNKTNNVSYVYITITEGRNHQVKDMFLSMGHEVLKLKREKYSFLDICNLNIGEYRKLTPKEVKKLYNESNKNN